MCDEQHNLAIEMSSRSGSIALGRGDELLATATLATRTRHNVELMATIDQVFRDHGAAPRDLGEVCVSIGPGSFTGLRIAVATVKMLAFALDVRVTVVPTLDVVAQNLPADRDRVAVCLNAKREHQRMYCGVFRQQDDNWKICFGPEILTAAQLVQRAGRPLAVLGAHLPDGDWPDDVEKLDPALAAPRADAVWRLGRALSARRQLADPWTLLPLYARRPDAEEVWQRKQRDIVDQHK